MIRRRPAVLVLAAGRGQRFLGQGHKLAQKFGDQEELAFDTEPGVSDTVLTATVAHAIETGLRVVVVTSAALAPLVLGQVAARDVVVLPELDRSGRPASFGMGHSIAAGVGASGDAEGWLIVPGDMPLLQSFSMLAVAAALDQFPVAFAQHHGRRGHPVGFSAELFSELLELQGDEGARRLVARYPSQAVELDDPGVLLDVDTVEDLARVQRMKLSLLKT